MQPTTDAEKLADELERQLDEACAFTNRHRRAGVKRHDAISADDKFCRWIGENGDSIIRLLREGAQDAKRLDFLSGDEDGDPVTEKYGCLDKDIWQYLAEVNESINDEHWAPGAMAKAFRTMIDDAIAALSPDPQEVQRGE